MIQTIQTIDMYDGTCIAIKFHYVQKVNNSMNMNSHGMSYLSERKYSQEEFGDVMAFDNPESQLESLASDRLGGVRH